MIINISLLILSTVALTISLAYFSREIKFNFINFYLMLLGLATFLWCFGYGMMGMMEDFGNALIYRNIGLFGVIAYLIIEDLFLLRTSLCVSTKTRKIAFIILNVLGIIDFILFSNPDVIQFIREGDRTFFLAVQTIARIYHYIFLIAISIFTGVIGVIWYKRCSLKREKSQVRTMFVVNFIIIACAFPDTVLPSLHIPSVPASAFGATLAFIIIYAMSIRENAFSLSMRNIAVYIYRYAEYPVLVLDYKGQIVNMSDYTKKFFGIEDNEVQRISQLFEMTRTQEDELWATMQDAKQISTATYVTKNTHKTCILNATTVLDSNEEVYCVICFFNDISRETERLAELDAMGKQLTHELNTQSKQLERITLQAISSIANMIDAKDSYTKGHSIRVGEYCVLIAQKLGWKEDAIQDLKYIAFLHDIGKIAIPDAVRNKPGRLTPAETELIHSHTTIGADILRDIQIISHMADGALYHHERYDGNGYPEGLKGKDIPLVARVICVANTYDAMSCERVYRQKMEPAMIRQKMIAQRGKQFDPEILDAFIELLDEGKLNSVSELHEPKMIVETAAEAGGVLMQKVFNQIDENRQIEDELDYLTQLHTRKSGEKRIRELVLEHAGCVLIIDMDNLKQVNDLHGHLAGDYVLKVLGEVLASHEKEAFFCRLGGDEFLGFASDMNREEVNQLVMKINEDFTVHKNNSEVLAKTSLSIGMCMTDKGDSYEEALQNADRALYYVKQTGKAGSTFYKGAVPTLSSDSVPDLHHLVQALLNQGSYQGSFFLKYREFAQVFYYTQNLAVRYHYELQFIMITTKYENTEDIDIDQQEVLMEHMNEAINNSLRSVDVTIRYSNTQHLVILLQANSSKVNEIVERIIHNFNQIFSSNNVSISYVTEEIHGKDVNPSPTAIQQKN